MRRPIPILLCLAVAIAGCLGPTATVPPPAPTPPPVHGTFTVAFVDVGQGDGAVFELPDGSIIVYDCGPPADNASLSPMVRYLNSIGHARGSKVFGVIASHGHLDHIGGCEEVLDEYEVEHIYEVWYEGQDAPNSYNRWITQVINENATVHTARATDFLEGEQVFRQWDALALPQAAYDDGLRAQIVWPPNANVPAWADIGFYSLAVRWSFGYTDYCVQGDIEQDQESTLAGYPQDLNCEVYLVGHHGSQSSSSAPWVQKMAPKVAPVSFGANDYRHPTAAALCRVQQAGAKVYATDRLGTVTVSTDGTIATVTPDHAETANYCQTGADYWATVGTPPLSPPPAPPPPPPPPPPPGNATLAITATVSSASPCQYTTVTVSVHASRASTPVSGASVSSTWNYKTSSPVESGTTNAAGDAALSRYISGAAAGYEVVVDVTASETGQSAGATVSFIPRAC